MKMMLVLLFTFFMSNAAQASEFELKVYFNLAAAEKHDMVHCAIGGKKLKTEYHLAVFKDKPNYTILGNLDLDDNITADVANVRLAPGEDYFLQKKYIDESGVMVVETMNTNNRTNNDAALIKRSDLIYSIEIKRMYADILHTTHTRFMRVFLLPNKKTLKSCRPQATPIPRPVVFYYIRS